MIIRLIVNTIALLIVARIIPGIEISSIGAAVLVAIVLGIVNAVLRPILVVLSLPLEILSLGLFTLVINGALFLLVAHLGLGLHIEGWGAAILGSLALSVVSFLLSMLVGAAEKAI